MRDSCVSNVSIERRKLDHRDCKLGAVIEASYSRMLLPSAVIESTWKKIRSMNFLMTDIPVFQEAIFVEEREVTYV